MQTMYPRVLRLIKKKKMEIQARTTETMSSLLRDLSDMGVAVNPNYPTPQILEANQIKAGP